MTDSSSLRRAGGHLGAVASLMSAHAVALIAGLVTGPIVARALGVEGRGELAAIVVVLTLAPLVLDLGLPSWLARERARGGSRGDLLGAVLPLAVMGSVAGMVLALPLSKAIGNGREVVEDFILLGLLLAPLLVLPTTLIGVAYGESRWGLVSATQITASLLPLVVIVVLLITGRLTVGTAAAAYVVSLVLANLLLLRTLGGLRKLSFSAKRTKEALKFGLQTWLIAVALGSNQRLDQALMAALVSSEELGLYVVAVTTTSLVYGLIGAVSHAVFPSAAAGDSRLVVRSCRVTMSVIAVAAAATALVSPVFVPLLFGRAFEDAVPMVLILLLASVPRAASLMLDSAFTAIGDPAAALKAEMIGLAVTIPALVVFLPAYGGRGAAIVSLMAYTVQFVIQLTMAQRRLHARWWEFVVPIRADFSWLGNQVATALAKRGDP